ncbi:hypothetical protein HMSSN036_25810 [Paenibacillus macerans]|nr:hypothetical protein HMSSN036_25810 [Paenibacillus macerans]
MAADKQNDRLRDARHSGSDPARGTGGHHVFGPSSNISQIYEIPLAYPRDVSAAEFYEYYRRIQAHFDE